MKRQSALIIALFGPSTVSASEAEGANNQKGGEVPPNRFESGFAIPFLGIPNPAEVTSAFTGFWTEVQDQAREFTRKMTPPMQMFARQMQAAGLPAPLVHGFREIEVPRGSLIPQFVPDIPIMGSLNPAGWAQDYVSTTLNPPIFNLIGPGAFALLPGLGGKSPIANPPINMEFLGPDTDLASSVARLYFPSLLTNEQAPGQAPVLLNFPELNSNSVTANGNKRQLSMAGDLLQNSFNRLNEIATGNGPNGMLPLFGTASAGPASAGPASVGPTGPIQTLLNNIGAGGGVLRDGGPMGGFLRNPLLQLTEAGTGQALGQGLLEPVFSVVNGSGSGGIVKGLLDRTMRLTADQS